MENKIAKSSLIVLLGLSITGNNTLTYAEGLDCVTRGDNVFCIEGIYEEYRDPLYRQNTFDAPNYNKPAQQDSRDILDLLIELKTEQNKNKIRDDSIRKKRNISIKHKITRYNGKQYTIDSKYIPHSYLKDVLLAIPNSFFSCDTDRYNGRNDSWTINPKSNNPITFKCNQNCGDFIPLFNYSQTSECRMELLNSKKDEIGSFTVK